MQNQAILEDLLAILENNNVAIRRDAMGGGGGGLCKIKKSSIFFVDTDASFVESATVCARAVKEIVDIERVYVRPRVRQFLESLQ